MKRLIYAPKVWIFIRSSNITEIVDGQERARIYDVSSDILRGSVTQNLGDVSKARFELRNRFHKWLRSKEDGNRQIFLPMDLCTIWMQRISGRPVQVFTGYLDSVPYYQAYPGTVIFEASCTLKKLAFNWFDPGLTVFHGWLERNGWLFDPSTGQVKTQLSTEQSGALGGLVAGSANFADLLGRFMVDIGGWDPNDVVIGGLPLDIGEAAADLMSTMTDSLDLNRKQLAQFYGQILGIHGFKGSDVVAEDESDKGAGLVTVNRTLIPTVPQLEKIKSIGAQNGVPSWMLIFAATLLSSMRADKKVDEDDGSNWGYGLYSMRPNSNIGDIKIVDGVPVDNLMDPGIATLIFCKRLNRPENLRIGGDTSAAFKGDIKAALSWISRTLGYEVPTGGYDLQAIKDRAYQLSGTSKSKLPDESDKIPKPEKVGPSTLIDVANTPITSELVSRQLGTEELKVVESTYKDHAPEMGYVVLSVKQFSSGLKLRPMDGLQKNQVFFQGSDSRLEGLFNALKGKNVYEYVWLKLGGPGRTLGRGVEQSQGTNDLSVNGILITGSLEMLAALGTTTPDLPEAVGDGSEAALTIQQLAAFSANAAFAANFAFPTDMISSALLVGEKALMNDISCLEAVKQFCQASMRTFRSLPDGRFLAFYPDYFGTIRPPYWKINNIEIIDFGIQLSDESLATHVYVIGDSFYGADFDLGNQIMSHGVATITMARMLDSFMVPLNGWNTKDSNELKRSQAYDFLQHYGARPLKEDVPIIRNRDYEFLMAWQKFTWLWANQFATTVSFTFQPEVMAGGLVAFPEHQIQMFCESVTHNFDYEGGFTTDAVMTAPSLIEGADWQRSMKPGFALGGGINTVGVSG